MGTERWATHVESGVCSVQFDRDDVPMNKLLAGGLDGRFRVFDARTQHPLKARRHLFNPGAHHTILSFLAIIK